MIHHLALTAAHLEVAITLHDAFLGALGYERTLTKDTLVAYEGPGTEILIYAARADQIQNRHRTYDHGIHHIAFRVDDRATVDRAHAAALGAGARQLDAPRAYPDYSETYYAAFFEDGDGIKFEVMTD